MPNQSPEFDPSPIEFLSRRLDALEDAVRALLREKWDLEYPPGHADREKMKPEMLYGLGARRTEKQI